MALTLGLCGGPVFAQTRDAPAPAPAPAPTFAAAPETTTAPTTSSETAARELFRRAREAYDLQRFSEALALFEEAYKLDPRPHTLFSIAQCHRHLGNWDRAAFTYRRFLDLGAPDPKTERLARELLAETERRQAGQSDVPRQPQSSRPSENLQPLPPFEPTPMPEPVAEAPLLDAPQAPITRRWWFWAGTGTVAAALVGGIVYAATRPEERVPTLGEADLSR